MSLTPAEQYLLELINRARLDPQAEADLYGIDLNEGLAPGTITAASKQVLAPNDLLNNAAAGHSDWMLDANEFSHTGVNGSSPKTRMETAGYSFDGSWASGENIAWYGSTGTVNLYAAIDVHHQGLFLSEGHRENILADDFREIGIGQERGDYDYEGETYDSSMLTTKFAKSGANVFLTGVVYDDWNNNLFYNIDEGRAAGVFASGGSTVSTGLTGGYSIEMSASSNRLVEVTYSDGLDAELRLDMSGGNAKLDYIVGGPMLSSVTTTIVSGVNEVHLLGVNDLDLTGHNGANTLVGNKGDNVIKGRNGNDDLFGGAGDDTLTGGSGADTLDGGDGSDVYNADGFDFISDSGGSGYDVLRLSGNADAHVDMHIQGIERVEGANGNDVLDGSDMSLEVIIMGEAGSDNVIGGSADDQLSGGSGNDQIAGGGSTTEVVDVDTIMSSFTRGETFDLSGEDGGFF